MAGTVRKRSWATRKGEVKTAWQLDYFDQQGKRRKEQYRTRREADARLLVIRGEVRDGIHVLEADSITIAEAALRWLQDRRLEGLERGSLRTYAQYVEVINRLIGARKLSRLTVPLVNEFRKALLADPKLSRGRATSILSALRMVIKAAQGEGLVAQNVAREVTIRSSSRDDKPVEVGVDIPTKEEASALLQHAAGRNRPRIVTLIFTGLRASELRGLAWSHVDFIERMIRVRQRADQWGTLGAPKSGNGYRDIPMTPTVINTLREWKLACSHSTSNLVFPGHRGRPLNHSSLQLAFEEVQREAGIVDATGDPKYTLHALRHFFASWGIEQGFSPKRLQQLMGHGSMRMTYDVYGHLFPTPEDDHARFAAGELALLCPR
jgi:integrase